MRRTKFLQHPARINDLSLDEYENYEFDKPTKMQRMHIRQWRKLKHQLT